MRDLGGISREQRRCRQGDRDAREERDKARASAFAARAGWGMAGGGTPASHGGRNYCPFHPWGIGNYDGRFFRPIRRYRRQRNVSSQLRPGRESGAGGGSDNASRAACSPHHVKTNRYRPYAGFSLLSNRALVFALPTIQNIPSEPIASTSSPTKNTGHIFASPLTKSTVPVTKRANNPGTVKANHAAQYLVATKPNNIDAIARPISPLSK